MQRFLDWLFPSRVMDSNIAWLVRAAFERGYKSTGDDWLSSWKETPERETLLRMGLIDKNDTWR